MTDVYSVCPICDEPIRLPETHCPKCGAAIPGSEDIPPVPLPPGDAKELPDTSGTYEEKDSDPEKETEELAMDVKGVQERYAPAPVKKELPEPSEHLFPKPIEAPARRVSQPDTPERQSSRIAYLIIAIILLLCIAAAFAILSR